jgi:hypothetical protein
MTNSEISMMAMMKECMKGCRWCAFMPIAFGTILFLLGYYLEAEIVRILWLVFTGLMVLMGVFMLVIVSAFFR